MLALVAQLAIWVILDDWHAELAAQLDQPVSTLQGGARLIGTIWPTTYYMHSSVGAYTKGLAPHLMTQDLVVLACTIPILLVISMLGLRKQDR